MCIKDGEVDERELTMLQTFHLGPLSILDNVDHKMEAETRTELQKKSTGRDQQTQKGHKWYLMICALFPVCYLKCYHSAKSE